MKIGNLALGAAFWGLLCQAGCSPPVTTENQSSEPTGASQPVATTFANPQLLVETDWLEDHLSDPQVRVIDTRSEEDFAAGHIPGAISIPRSATHNPDGARSTVGTPESISELFGSKGVNEEHHVILYDNGRSTAASRVFWVLDYYRHPDVSVLNGGLDKWNAEMRSLSTEVVEPEPVIFSAVARAEALSSMEEVLEGVGASSVVMLDARAPGEHSGEILHSERGGHIPGAVNIEWTENFEAGEAPVFKSAAELAKLYERAGVTPDKSVHAY